MEKIVVEPDFIVSATPERKAFIDALCKQEGVTNNPYDPQHYDPQQHGIMQNLWPILKEKYGIDIDPTSRNGGMMLDARSLKAFKDYISTHPEQFSSEIKNTFNALVESEMFDIDKIAGLESPNGRSRINKKSAQSQPNASDVADFQKMLADGDSPEAKALAEALRAQKGGLGTWGPKSKAAFTAACKEAGIDPQTVDFSDPKALMAQLAVGVKTERPDLTNGLEILPFEHKTTEQLIDDYIKGRAELLGCSESKIRNQLDRDGSGKISKEELVKDFNENAPRRVWHSEYDGRVGVLINGSNVITDPDNPFAQDNKIDSLDGLMRQISNRLGIGYDGKTYTPQSNGTWLPTGLGDGVLMTPSQPDHNPRMRPFRDLGENVEGGPNSPLPPHLENEQKNTKLEALLKSYNFQPENSFAYADASEHTRNTTSSVQSTLTVSKGNAIG